MSAILKPRRGKATTATTQNIVLKKGEVFFELANNSVPTTGANATAFGKIKMGDGSTAYSNLGYFIDVDTTAVAWDNTGYTSATSANQGSSLYTHLNNMTPSATLKTILTNTKALLYKLATQVTQLNNDSFDPSLYATKSELQNVYQELYDMITIATLSDQDYTAIALMNGLGRLSGKSAVYPANTCDISGTKLHVSHFKGSTSATANSDVSQNHAALSVTDTNGVTIFSRSSSNKGYTISLSADEDLDVTLIGSDAYRLSFNMLSRTWMQANPPTSNGSGWIELTIDYVIARSGAIIYNENLQNE